MSVCLSIHLSIASALEMFYVQCRFPPLDGAAVSCARSYGTIHMSSAAKGHIPSRSYKKTVILSVLQGTEILDFFTK